MAAKGELEPLDCAIFADTLWERQATYDHLDWLAGQLPFPLHRVSTGSTRDRALAPGFNGIPFHAEQPDGRRGMGAQQCTNKHKIEPMRAKIRELLGVRKGAWVRSHAELWIGISLDEMTRMKDAREVWLTHRWPLIERHMNRNDCLRWFERHYPGRTLAKSSCVGCPFHSTPLWRELRETDPAAFADAVAVDAAIRDARPGVQQFMHRRCLPLAEAVEAADREASAQREFAFEQECNGLCGV
jgi:hypothetical protein